MNSWQHAIDYLLGCRPSHYVWWQGGAVSPGDSAPAWADNTPPPPTWRIQAEGGFCIAAANLMMRDVGATIPNPFNDLAWDGGTLSSYKGFYDASQWFNPELDYPDLWFLVSGYKEDGWGNMVQEGHGAVTYQGYCVEWIHKGLVWEFTTYESYDWGKYELAVPPEVWLGKDEGGGTPVPIPIPEPAPRPTSKGLTAELLIAAMTSPTFTGADIDPDDAVKFLPSIIKYCAKYEINNRARFSQWLGQMGHESGSFRTWGEVGGGGGRFGQYYGSGPGQLTWEDTFREFQEATGWPAWDDPDIVRDRDNPDPGFEAATWLWQQKELNYWADFDSYEGYSNITLRWLGTDVHQSVPDRIARYDHAWATLPEDFDITATDKPDVIVPKPEGDLVFAKYNFAAIGQPFVDFANAAVLVLEAAGIDSMAVNGEANIRGAAGLSQKDQYLIIVGNQAYGMVPSEYEDLTGWHEQATIWTALSQETVDSLIFLRNWVLWWITTQAENKNYDVVLRGFDDTLKITSDTYANFIDLAKGKNAPDPPPPPEMEEIWLPLSSVRPEDTIKVYRRKGL